MEKSTDRRGLWGKAIKTELDSLEKILPGEKTELDSMEEGRNYSIEKNQGRLGYLESVLERVHLQGIEKSLDYNAAQIVLQKVTWLQLLRIPVDPTGSQMLDLLSYWQNALATFNVWGNQFVFLLLRMNGETGIYFGVIAEKQEMDVNQAIRQVKQATSAAIPGMEVASLVEDESKRLITEQLEQFNSYGAITGIPSLREQGRGEEAQTLDALAFGFKGETDEYTDYAALMICRPIEEMKLTEIMYKFRKQIETVHSMVRTNVSRNAGVSAGKSESVDITTGSLDGIVNQTLVDLSQFKVGMHYGKNSSVSHGRNLSMDWLNKSAQYVENAMEAYIERMRRGRNLGFWNTGVYVLARSDNDVRTVLGILKSVYAGDNSYLEPIRANVLHGEKGLKMVKNFQLLPFESGNPFGDSFNYISTPLNTEELAIVTALPRKDVPGIRFSKTAVRFATNPAEVVDEDAMEIGHIMDMGVVQNKLYRMNADALVRHALVAGCTGSGKSTTCKKFLSEADARGISSLIIEPAKDDYVRWAIAYNRRIDEDITLSEEEKEEKKFDIYMPGVEMLDGYRMRKLKINPFESAAIPGAPIDLMSRYEQVVTIINASIPSSDVLPVLIDETVYRYMNQFFGADFQKEATEQRIEYPKMDGLLAVARQVLEERNYDKKVQNDIAAALDTRFNYLIRGKRGSILNVRKSTDYHRLFNHKTVINLSRMTGSKDKAMIMSFLVSALYEYRNSAFSFDADYRARANENKLLHLTLIEEAHNLLQKPEMDIGGSGNPQKVSAEMFTNILSEIRSYGQGLIIVDQVPTRLIPDAIKNTNYKIIHRLTAADDAAAVAASMSLSEEQVGIISRLRIGEAIVCGDLDDAALWIKIKRD